MKFLMYGAGAIGTYIGGSLLLAGHNVVFLERERAAVELRERGLRLDLTLDPRRNTHEASMIAARTFIAASTLAEALRHGPFDVAIYALKSFDTPAALDEMRPLVDKMPPILCLSNGVDNEDALAALLGADKVIAGTVTSAIARRAAGDVVLERLRGLGVAAGNQLSQRLVAVLDSAELNARLYPDARSMKWSKLFTNLIANPASAILNMSVAEIFSDRKLYRLEMDMLRECLSVMRAQGLQVIDPPGVQARALAFATRLPDWLSKPLVTRSIASGRGGKMPSFHIDLHSGRGKTEVDYLHGAVVRAGRKFGVQTPVNDALTKILLALTAKEIPLDQYAGQPEKLLAATAAEH